MRIKVIPALLITGLLLAACGDSELKLYTPDAVTSDLGINIHQKNDAPWTATYEKGARNPIDVLPLSKTIALQFHAEEHGHTLYIPELAINLSGHAKQTAQSWVSVNKPVSVKVLCEQHPQEDTSLILTFK